MRTVVAFLVLSTACCAGATYHVSPRGNDADPGTTERPFQTIQKGADLLKAGDTLVVGPGVYHESVKIGERIGTKEEPIVIRAAVPRASFLVGSVTLADWHKAPGTRATYRAALRTPTTLVYERDTNREYVEKADLYQVDETAASFMCDEDKGQIYVHTSDDAHPGKHLIDACVHRIGFDLLSGGPANWQISLRKHIRIEGFVLAGYAGAGIHVMRGDSCEVRNCVVHHCGAGIFMHSSIRSAIRDCEASWCYDRNDNEGGGIGFRGRLYDDVIENCVAHDIVKYGIRHYAGGFQGCVIRGCLTYRVGRCAIHTKGTPDVTRRYANMFTPPASDIPILVERNVAVEKVRPHTVLFSCWGMRHNTAGALDTPAYRGGKNETRDTQLLFDPDKIAESGFADPAYYDFRLQSDSPHRGKNVGAHSYGGDVFFAKPEGDDEAEGTSVAAAWRDVSRALARLSPGQTLYVLPGRYAVSATIRLAPALSNGGPDISVRRPPRMARLGRQECLPHRELQGRCIVRAHGKGDVIFDGAARQDVAVDVAGDGVLELSGIRFTRYRAAAVHSTERARLEIRRCIFDSNGSGVAADAPARVSKCIFYGNRGPGARAGEKAAPLEIYGCILWKNRVAFDVTRPPLSNFNDLGGGAIAQMAGKSSADLAAWRRASGQDTESISADPQFTDPAAGDFRLSRTSPCRGRGYLWSPTGVEPTPHHWFESPGRPQFKEVRASLVTPTMANLAWRTEGGKSTALVRFGLAKDKLDKVIERTTGQHLGSFHAVTLFDLKPGTTYYFQVGSAPYRMMFAGHFAEPMDSSPPVWDGEVRSFTTPARFTPKRRTLYVSKADGDDANDGLTRATAFASVHRASRVAEPGDTVIVGAGEYFGLLRPVHSGMPNAPIVFQAAPGERVELSGKRLTQPRSALLLDKRHVVLRGFVFKEHCKMLQDDVGGGAQLMIGDCRDIRVEHCLFDGRMYYMMSVRVFRSADVRFSDNVFFIWTNYTGLSLGMNTGPIVFDHNTLYTAAVTFGYITRNANVVFTNNIFGEKIRVKWTQPKFNIFVNRRIVFDRNYYAFDDENKARYALRIRRKEDEPYIECRGEDPLARARELGWEEHGRAGPLPWAKADLLAEKSKRIRGIQYRLQNYGPLEFSDFILTPDARCRGMGSDGLDPGRRAP